MAKDIEQQAQEGKQPKKGFLTSPTAEDLKPSYDEMMVIKLLQEGSEAAAKSERILGEPKKTFLTAPTAEQLQFSPREQSLLRALVTWNETSIDTMELGDTRYNSSVSYSA
tara:strand:+ start:10657 stop:10989 length:333 start_codon:yes stop_codon:yes gene_type:complete